MAGEPAGRLVAVAGAVGANALVWFAIGLTVTCGLTALSWLMLRHRSRIWQFRLQEGTMQLQQLLMVMGLAFVAVASAGILLFAAIGARISSGHPMVIADHVLADAIGTHVAPAALRVFAWLTHPGDPAVLAVLCVVILVALWKCRRRMLALAWTVAMTGNALLNPALKQAFERARPSAEGVLASAPGFSFPSGHTSGAMVAYAMLGYIALRTLPPRWHGAALVLAAAIVFTTAASRVMLQVHFASDVIAGLASGGTWVLACIASAETALHYRRSRRPEQRQ